MVAMPSERCDFHDRRRVANAAYEAAYREWVATNPPAMRRLLREQGIDEPFVERMVETDGGGGEEQSAPPETGAWSHPMDAMEPVSEADVNEIALVFGAALNWAARGKTLVDVGQRVLVMLHLFKKELIAGLAFEIRREMERELRVASAQRKEVGRAYGAALVWLRNARSLSQLGQRLLAMDYVVNGVTTLQEIGNRANKTRQAVDKLALDFRDTFRGLRNRTMRSDENRERCRQAQLRLAM